MKLITSTVSKEELIQMSQGFAGGFVKAVVDINRGIMVVDAPMHADEEKELLDNGSNQDDLWGINLYPELPDGDFIEFDSMINIRPRMNNFSRGIEDENIQKKIIAIVTKLVV